MFDELKYFTPSTYHYKHGTTEKYFHNDIDLLEIQRIGNHCVALIPKAEIKKRLPKFDLEGLMKKAEPLEVVDSLLSPAAAWRTRTKPRVYNIAQLAYLFRSLTTV